MLSKPSFLLVDDDRFYGALIADALRDYGADVMHVQRLVEAERMLTSRRFDAIIADGLLPDGSGLEFIRKRRVQFGDKTPVVFCSAFWKDLNSQRQIRVDLGVEAVLTKPFQAKDVVKALSQFLPDGAAEKSEPAPIAPWARKPIIGRY